MVLANSRNRAKKARASKQTGFGFGCKGMTARWQLTIWGLILIAKE